MSDTALDTGTTARAPVCGRTVSRAIARPVTLHAGARVSPRPAFWSHP